MTARLRYLHYEIVHSFWFIPAIMLAGAILLAFASGMLDRALQELWSGGALSWILWVGPEGARTILQVIAGSMIGATSLVFSMTLVSLTLASQQLGPRLLAIFRGDRTTQVALGVFIATLAYALLMLRLVPPETAEGVEFVPVISVSAAQLLTLCSLGVLIYFIHHLAELLEADTIVSEVGDDLDASVQQLFPRTPNPEDATERADDEPERQREPKPGAPPTDRFFMLVQAERAGYVQTMAQEQLVELADSLDGRIQLVVMPGDFLVEGQTLARFWPLDKANDRVKRQIRHALTIGPKRTQAEDLEYAVNALVEIALRALSPSLNDPFTAIACINRIGSALALVIARHDPPRHHYGSQGRLRLTVPAHGFIELLDHGFNDIRRAALEHPAVLRYLVRRLASLAELAADPNRRQAIARHGEAVRRAAARHVEEPLDRERIEPELERLSVNLRRWENR